MTYGDDLSNGKYASQILTYPHPLHNATYYIASNAVDRNPSSCTRNYAIGGNPYEARLSVHWSVDLGDIHSIHSIRILFKDYGAPYVERQRGRFAGFSIYISNSTDMDDWFLCYKDKSELPPLDFNATCMKHGRYVIYYNERLKEVTYPDSYQIPTTTELCEVIVHGCAKKGVYGVNCDLPCPVNCQEQRCHIVNGSCLGCKPGWTGDTCDKLCPSGWYGLGCQQGCVGHCQHIASCHHESGSCVDGCTAGWMGPLCNKECGDGTYGQDCIHKCSGNCLNSSHCNKTTGSCDLGCSPGYIGTLCNKSCPIRKFGILCRETCSGHCLNDTNCNHVNGSCNKGCNNGYTGDMCNKSCERGLFGSNCSEKCSINCRTAYECFHTNGSCVCLPGWTGSPHCNKECDPGFYGENCQKHCKDYCVNATCNRTDGGCLAGYIQENKPEKGEDRKPLVSYKKEYYTVSGIFGAMGVVSLVIIAVLIIRGKKTFSICRMPKDRNISAETDKAEGGHSNANKIVQNDKTLYQELSVFENKSAYQELHYEKNPYENLELTVN